MTPSLFRRPGLLVWVFLLLLSSSVQAAQALLWRVDNGQGAVSYLFGTIHSEDPRVTNLPEAVTKPFAEAKTVVLEMKLTPEVQQQMTTAILLPSEQQLSDLLPADLYKATLSAMAQRGYPDEVTARLRPWALILTLSMPPAKTGNFLDVLLYQRALTAGKQVEGLETADEQLAIFRELSLADQQALLRQTLKDNHKQPDMLETMTQAWLDRDLNKLSVLNEKSMDELSPGLQQRFGQRLVEMRNHRMAERALPILQQGGAFVAVGALHLVGDEGLVALLRGEGMKVTPVY